MPSTLGKGCKNVVFMRSFRGAATRRKQTERSEGFPSPSRRVSFDPGRESGAIRFQTVLSLSVRIFFTHFLDCPDRPNRSEEIRILGGGPVFPRAPGGRVVGRPGTSACSYPEPALTGAPWITGKNKGWEPLPQLTIQSDSRDALIKDKTTCVRDRHQASFCPHQAGRTTQ